MKVTIEYRTHHYVKTYVKCVLFCPNCGKQEVWEELGGGDYYLGVDYVCTNCDASHCLDHTGTGGDSPDITRQIRDGKADEPKSKVGG